MSALRVQLASVWFLGFACVAAAAVPRLDNADLSSVEGGRFVGWSHMGLCVMDGTAAHMTCTAADQNAGLVQILRCDPPATVPFTASARARSREVGTTGDFAVWLDLIHADGSPSWGHVAGFARGSHDWQEARIDITPAKPVAEIRFHLLLRHTTGEAWFANPRLEPTPLVFRHVQAVAGLWGPGTLTIRAQTNMPARIGVQDLPVSSSQSAADENRTFCLDLAGLTDLPGSVRLHAAALNDAENRADLPVSVVTATASAATAWRAWAEPLSTRIFSDTPACVGSCDAAISLEAVRDGHVGVQVAVAANPHGRAQAVDVQMSDLTGPAGSIRGSAWQRRRVGFIRNEQPARHPHLEHDGPTWWPDPLLAWRPLSIPRGQTRSAVLDTRIPESLPPGAYAGHVSVTDEAGLVARIPMRLVVHPLTLPRRPRIRTAFALMDGFLEKIYGTVTPQLRRAYTQFVLDHRLNPDDISRTRLPDLDELSFAKDRGLNAFNILNLVPEAGPGVTWVCFSPTEAYTPQFKQRLIERLDAFVPELEKRGLLDHAYIYGFDERSEEYLPIMREYFGLVKERYPRVRTLSTCWPPAGTDPASLNIDWYCPLSNKYDPVMAEKVRARGGEMWWYICMGPTWPYANWLFEYPLVEARLIWWQTWQEKVDGFLYWGLNIWDRPRNDAPIPDDADVLLSWSTTPFEPLHGDGVLLYPGQRGPIGSLRLLAIRDGMEDAMILDLAEQVLGRTAVEEIVHKVSRGMTEFTRDASVLQSARSELLSRLGGAGSGGRR